MFDLKYWSFGDLVDGAYGWRNIKEDEKNAFVDNAEAYMIYPLEGKFVLNELCDTPSYFQFDDEGGFVYFDTPMEAIEHVKAIIEEGEFNPIFDGRIFVHGSLWEDFVEKYGDGLRSEGVHSIVFMS